MTVGTLDATEIHARRKSAKSNNLAWGNPVVYFVALLFVGLMISPVLYIVVGGFRTNAQITTDPAAFQRYQAAQNNVSMALLPFRVLQENYPDLKSNANFMALQSQLEGTENRIAIARRDYNQTAQTYNTTLRTFPTVLWAKTLYSGQKPAQLFQANAAAQNAPSVDFGAPAAPAVQP